MYSLHTCTVTGRTLRLADSNVECVSSPFGAEQHTMLCFFCSLMINVVNDEAFEL